MAANSPYLFISSSPFYTRYGKHDTGCRGRLDVACLARNIQSEATRDTANSASAFPFLGQRAGLLGS
jgi:hypothetical protein